MKLDDIQELSSLIYEKKKDILNNRDKPELLHCNRCKNRCTLDKPKCYRGAEIKDKLQEL